jgi:hypothetical protein
LEQKFHAHYFIGSNEKNLIDLTTLRQRNNETPMEFLRRFRKTKSMCFSLNILDDQLAGMAVAGMLPAIREKLFGIVGVLYRQTYQGVPEVVDFAVRIVIG